MNLEINMDNLIRKNIRQISELCQRYGVRKLYAFGSVVSGKFIEDSSDIDLLVELLPMSPIDKGLHKHKKRIAPDNL